MPFDGRTWTPPLVRDQHDLNLLREMRAGIAAPGGWCQGVGTAGAAHCIMGWTTAVMGDGQQYAWVDRVLVPELPTPFRNRGEVVRFNDCRCTTQADVVALFDRAIAKLEAPHAI